MPQCIKYVIYTFSAEGLNNYVLHRCVALAACGCCRWWATQGAIPSFCLCCQTSRMRSRTSWVTPTSLRRSANALVMTPALWINCSAEFDNFLNWDLCQGLERCLRNCDWRKCTSAPLKFCFKNSKHMQHIKHSTVMPLEEYILITHHSTAISADPFHPRY